MQFSSIISILSLVSALPLLEVQCLWAPTACSQPCAPGYACKVSPATPFVCQAAVCEPILVCVDMLPQCKFMCMNGLECGVVAAKSVFECPTAACVPKKATPVVDPATDDSDKSPVKNLALRCPRMALSCFSCGSDSVEGTNCTIVPHSDTKCGFVQCHS